jgi:hypothetical protein
VTAFWVLKLRIQGRYTKYRMKIAQTYSHLNGLEWLLQTKPQIWSEIEQVIEDVDAESCKTKISKEKSMKGRKLYAPKELNKKFENGLKSKSWTHKGRLPFYTCVDPSVIKECLGLPPEDQKRIIEDYKLEAIPSSNEGDFEKERVAIEIQFGKYSFVQFDIFIKHAARYMKGEIDLGIEIVPMKAMEREMSSGPPYYEKHVHEILRQGRIFPPVPLLLIGVEP